MRIKDMRDHLSMRSEDDMEILHLKTIVETIDTFQDQQKSRAD